MISSELVTCCLLVTLIIATIVNVLYWRFLKHSTYESADISTNYDIDDLDLKIICK